MTVQAVVSNSSPLIALEQIGQLDLLARLFSSICVPPAVVREVAPTLAVPAWMKQHPLREGIGSRILQASLGSGESETIALALEMDARWVLLDDRPARRLASALRLPVIGTLGILLACKRRGLLPGLRPPLDELIAAGFRVSSELYARVLADAGEPQEEREG